MQPATSQKIEPTLFDRARAVTPGGVHSPVRAFGEVGGEPVFMTHANRAYLWDTEGKPYVDYCMAFGPLILGHAHPAVTDAATKAVADGWSYGTGEPYSLALAELITDRLPWVESIRFVNSGTEAVMTALRLARGATGRNKVVKFDGCYHGHSDAMLVKAGSSVAQQAEATSKGIPSAVAADTLVLPLGDEAAARRLFKAHGQNIAAVIIEPLPANQGLQPQAPQFIASLRRLCDEYDALLIFDEVISGFRLSFGGYVGLSGVEPDLVTYGKIIGGGFPVGAVGGRREYLNNLAPLGGVYQAGTLSANPLAMRAGYATLAQLLDGAIYEQLEATGQTLEAALLKQRISIVRLGSIWWLDNPAIAYGKLFHTLLAQGIYLPPSGAEVCFLSAAHNQEHIEELTNALITALT